LISNSGVLKNSPSYPFESMLLVEHDRPWNLGFWDEDAGLVYPFVDEYFLESLSVAI